MDINMFNHFSELTCLMDLTNRNIPGHNGKVACSKRLYQNVLMSRLLQV